MSQPQPNPARCPLCEAPIVELRPALKLLTLHRGEVVDIRWLNSRWYRVGLEQISTAITHMFNSQVLAARICEIHVFNSQTGRSFCPVDVRLRLGFNHPFKVTAFEPGANATKKARYKRVKSAAERAVRDMTSIANSRIVYRTGTECSQHPACYARHYWDGEGNSSTPKDFNSLAYIEEFYEG